MTIDYSLGQEQAVLYSLVACFVACLLAIPMAYRAFQPIVKRVLNTKRTTRTRLMKITFSFFTSCLTLLGVGVFVGGGTLMYSPIFFLIIFPLLNVFLHIEHLSLEAIIRQDLASGGLALRISAIYVGFSAFWLFFGPQFRLRKYRRRLPTPRALLPFHRGNAQLWRELKRFERAPIFNPWDRMIRDGLRPAPHFMRPNMVQLLHGAQLMFFCIAIWFLYRALTLEQGTLYTSALSWAILFIVDDAMLILSFAALTKGRIAFFHGCKLFAFNVAIFLLMMQLMSGRHDNVSSALLVLQMLFLIMQIGIGIAGYQEMRKYNCALPTGHEKRSGVQVQSESRSFAHYES